MPQARQGRCSPAPAVPSIDQSKCMGRGSRICSVHHTQRSACGCIAGAGACTRHRAVQNDAGMGCSGGCWWVKAWANTPHGWHGNSLHAAVEDGCTHHLSTVTTTQVNAVVPKDDAAAILREVSVLRARRMLRTLAIVQDCADMLLAVNDIKGRGYMSQHRRCVWWAHIPWHTQMARDA